MPLKSVRYIGSRELHRDLPKVLDTLGSSHARVVLTVHSKPKAVLIGAEAFQALLHRATPEDHLLALQLNALVQGLAQSAPDEATVDQPERFGVDQPGEN